MSQLLDENFNVEIAGTKIQIEKLILGVFVTLLAIISCITCSVVICLVRCFLLRNGYEFCPSQRVPSRQHHRDIENQPEQDEEESGKVRARDLSQAPPPAYRNANQYQNVDLKHTDIVRIKETYYRLSVHCESVDTTSLPPDYTSQRPSISVAPQETQVPEAPPTYDTAKLELMARRATMEEGSLRESRTSLPEVNTETHQFEFHIPSDS